MRVITEARLVDVSIVGEPLRPEWAIEVVASHEVPDADA